MADSTRTPGSLTSLRIDPEQPVDLALAELQSQLRQLGSAFPYGTWICDPEGRAIHLSESFLELVGMTLEEASGFGWSSRLAPEALEPTLEAWRTAVAAGTGWSGEHRIRDREGAYHSVLSRGVPIRGPDDTILAWAGINLDITARAEAEARLRESEERFRTATREMLDPFGIYRALRDETGEIYDFEVVFVNEAAADANRMPAEEQVGRRLGDLLPSHHRLGLLEQYARVVETREPLVLEDLEYADEYGEVQEKRVFDIRVAPLGDGFLSTWRDVTGRRVRERSLEEFRTRYEMVSRATNDVIWDWDLHTGRVRWNEALRRVMGYDPAEIEDPIPWWTERMHPEDRDRIRADIDEAIAAGAERWTGEYRFRRADGSWAEILDRGYIARNDEGRPTRMIGSMLDLTESRQAERERKELLRREQAARRETEAALKERSELLEQLESIYRNSPVGLCVLDRELRFVRVNDRLAEINGVPAEAHLGRTVREVLPAIADLVEPRLKKVLETGQAELGIEVTGETPAQPGVTRQWLEHWLPLRTANDTVVGISVVAEEVTKQRAAERTLREAERRQRLLARAGELLTVPMAADQRLGAFARLLTETVCDLCVIDVLEDEGEPCRAVVVHSDPERQDSVEALRRETPGVGSGILTAMQDRQPRLIPELTDDVLRELVADPGPLETARGLGMTSALIVPLTARERALGAVALFRTQPGRRFDEEDLEFVADLCDRAALSIDNARLYEGAREAVRDREDVLAAVSHDLRNPLHTIGMAASLILERDLPENRKAQQAKVIKNALGQALRLIEDLMDVSRLRSGNLSLKRAAESPADLVESAVGMAGGAATDKGVELLIAGARVAPDVNVDPERILQVLDNIISNAIRHTPEGGRIEVSASLRGDRVRVEVADTGPGIEAADLPHIFDRFWRAKESDRAGAGLGLAIAKGIVNAHGGEIGVESEPGKGACFWFDVPVARSEG